MKKYVLAALTLAVIVACNNSESPKPATDAPKEASETSISSNPDYKKGLALVAKSDCLTCHKVDEAINGPSYRQVAEKYADQGSDVIPMLADKIIKGGSGNWGSIPMLPHPSLSKDDAEAMVKYILLLKK